MAYPMDIFGINGKISIMTKNNTRRQSNCPITADPQKREEANRTTASIRDNLPEGLAQPALRALASAGINSLQDFTMVKQDDLARMHGIGPNALAKIKTALEKQGLTFLV